MNVVLWIIAGLLAVAFAGAGLMKLTQPKPKLAAAGMPWTEDFSDGQVKGIGALEVLGALGLILPAALGIAEVLTPIAAVGLALLMVGGVLAFAHETHPVSARNTGGFAATRRAAREVLGNRDYLGFLLTFCFAFAALFAYISASPSRRCCAAASPPRTSSPPAAESRPCPTSPTAV